MRVRSIDSPSSSLRRRQLTLRSALVSRTRPLSSSSILEVSTKPSANFRRRLIGGRGRGDGRKRRGREEAAVSSEDGGGRWLVPSFPSPHLLQFVLTRAYRSPELRLPPQGMSTSYNLHIPAHRDHSARPPLPRSNLVPHGHPLPRQPTPLQRLRSRAL